MTLLQRPSVRPLEGVAAEEDGFTLIELLVVIGIVGILAAMGLSAFLGKRVNAYDASAKEMAQTSEQAALTYGTTYGGYSSLTPAALKSVEPTINIDTSRPQTALAAAAPWPSAGSSGFTLSVVSADADTYTLTNNAGVVTRSCTVAAGNGSTSTNTGGGCRNGTW